MSRPANKRKSDGAAMAPLSKTRKVTIDSHTMHAGSNSFDPEDEQSEGGFVTPEQGVKQRVKPKASRKSEPARPSRGMEYEEDEGRAENQQFRKIVSVDNDKKKTMAKEASEYLSRFTRLVERDQEALGQKLKALSNAAEKNDSDFLAAFRKAYEATSEAPSEQEGRKEIVSKMAFSTKFQESQKMQKAALRLVTKFEEVGSSVMQIENAIPDIEKRWDYEDSRMRWLLSTGRTIGERRIESILTAAAKSPLDANDRRAADILFEKFEDDSESWGKMAMKQFRTFESLVRKFATD